MVPEACKILESFLRNKVTNDRHITPGTSLKALGRIFSSEGPEI